MSPSRSTSLVAAGAAAAVAATSLAGWSVCPLKVSTGLDCPLCGGTRAVVALARGDLVAALDHNVLVTAASSSLLAALPVAAWLLPRRRWRATVVARWALRAAVGAGLVFALARNLPFGWAAPLRSGLGGA